MCRLLEENQRLRMARAANEVISAPGIAGQPSEHVIGCQALAGIYTSLNDAIGAQQQDTACRQSLGTL